MKILITGMTSPQSSSRLNGRSMSFAGCISAIASDNGHSVEWFTPSVHLTKKDVDAYDYILVGIAPPLSVTSNKAYGVLKFISTMQSDSRLKFFVDSPEPSRITLNLRAVQKDQTRLVTQFHRLRKDYKDVVSDEKVRNGVLSGIDYLADGEWPETFYPEMPWINKEAIKSKLPAGASSTAVGICVDPFFITETFGKINATKCERWAVDTDKTRWSASAISSMQLPYQLMKTNKASTDTEVGELIATSKASLLSPTADGSVWWSYRWAQSMNSSTPIVSDWRVTSQLGVSWGHLAASVESMSYIDLFETSVTQKSEYLNALPSRDKVKERLGI